MHDIDDRLGGDGKGSIEGRTVGLLSPGVRGDARHGQ